MSGEQGDTDPAKADEASGPDSGFEKSDATADAGDEENEGETSSPTDDINTPRDEKDSPDKVSPQKATGKPRSKKLTEEEIRIEINDLLVKLRELPIEFTEEVNVLQKKLGRYHWDQKILRPAISDVLLCENFAEDAYRWLSAANKAGIFSNDTIWFPSYYCYNTIWNSSDANHTLAKAYADAGLLDLMVGNLRHEEYLQNMGKGNKNNDYLLKASLSIVYNMSRNLELRLMMEEANVVQALAPFLEMDSEFIKALAVMTLSNVLDEESGRDVLENAGVIKYLVRNLTKGLKVVKRRWQGLSTYEVADSLANLAVSDHNKHKIIEEGALPLFQSMLEAGSVDEQSCAARALWSLAFEETARNKILEEAAILEALHSLTESENDSVRKMVHGALWVIEQQMDRPERAMSRASTLVAAAGEDFSAGDARRAIAQSPAMLASSAATTPSEVEVQTRGKQVFISYTWHYQEAILKIRDALKGFGYTVWVDVDDMKGSLMDSMAEGVEQCSVFVMCVSERYMLSPNAKSEAVYAKQQGKPLIPIMMQKRFRATGWLGIMMAGLIWIKFADEANYDSSLQELDKRIAQIIRPVPEVVPRSKSSVSPTSAEKPTLPPPSAVSKKPAKSRLENWSKDDVMNWLNLEAGIDNASGFETFDGKMMLSLKEMKSKAPEFYYSSLERHMGLSFSDILRFSSMLEKLE